MFTLMSMVNIVFAQGKTKKLIAHSLTKPANMTTLPNGQVMYTGRDLMYFNNDNAIRSATLILPKLKIHFDKNRVPLPNDPDNPVIFITITSFPGIGAGSVYSLYALQYDNTTYTNNTEIAMSAAVQTGTGNNNPYYVDFMVIGKPDATPTPKK